MKAALNDRSTLVRLIERMSDMDVRQMLAYATGYEAGKISQPIQYSLFGIVYPVNKGL